MKSERGGSFFSNIGATISKKLDTKYVPFINRAAGLVQGDSTKSFCCNTVRRKSQSSLVGVLSSDNIGEDCQPSQSGVCDFKYNSESKPHQFKCFRYNKEKLKQAYIQNIKDKISDKYTDPAGKTFDNYLTYVQGLSADDIIKKITADYNSKDIKNIYLNLKEENSEMGCRYVPNIKNRVAKTFNAVGATVFAPAHLLETAYNSATGKKNDTKFISAGKTKTRKNKTRKQKNIQEKSKKNKTRRYK